MDKNQIKSYVQTNGESNPRFVFELDNFADAILMRIQQSGNKPTVDQIKSAWERWKLEHFDYVEHVKTFTQENKVSLENLVKDQLATLSDPKLKQEAELFATAYAQQLRHLGAQPLPEHIDIAWELWCQGKPI
jgi:hypothetical protein